MTLGSPRKTSPDLEFNWFIAFAVYGCEISYIIVSKNDFFLPMVSFRSIFWMETVFENLFSGAPPCNSLVLYLLLFISSTGDTLASIFTVSCLHQLSFWLTNICPFPPSSLSHLCHTLFSVLLLECYPSAKILFLHSFSRDPVLVWNDFLPWPHAFSSSVTSLQLLLPHYRLAKYQSGMLCDRKSRAFTGSTMLPI